MAAAIVPITGEAGIFQVSPTITAMDFHGKDDNLFRINRTTRDNAGDYAKVIHGRGQRHVAVAYDLRNRAFHTTPTCGVFGNRISPQPGRW